MAVATLTGFILSAVSEERARAQTALRGANDELGHRVAERTAELLDRVTQLDLAQERLRESEERFRGAFEFGGHRYGISSSEWPLVASQSLRVLDRRLHA